jgi:two-component system, LytTR family, sensor kinase
MIYGQARGDYYRQLILQIYYLPVLLGVTYFTLYFLIPKYLLKKNYLIFFTFVALSALTFSFLQRINIKYLAIPAVFPDYKGEYSLFSIEILFRIFTEYPVVVFAALIKIFSYWYQNEKNNQHLIQKNLEAELKFLRSQIYPHFLFNTLNNLYALTLKKSDAAPEMVLKLSALLNYVLYESNVKTIDLSNEIDLIENYIELEKIRYGNMLDISFNIIGEVAGNKIAPLLLLPFIENSFKHGVSRKIFDKWIEINLEILNSTLKLKVRNSKEESDGIVSHSYTEGIGLKNCKRRLELLYPDKHKLEINDNGNIFEVFLMVEMNNSFWDKQDEK